MKNASLLIALGLAALATLSCPAAIAVNGVSDETWYNDSRNFDVPEEAGYTITAELDGQPVATGVTHTVTEIDYHELFVRKVDDATSDEETLLVQFIIRDSSRQGAESGLPPWTPDRTIPSSAAEIDTGMLRFVSPAAYPAGWPVPVAAKIVDGTGACLRLNVDASANGTPVRLFRGAGGANLPAFAAAGPETLTLSAHALNTARAIQIEAAPAWADIGSDISSNTGWPAGSRVRITGDITISSGATLTVGAGSIVQIADGADIDIEANGELQVDGTAAEPVVFTAAPGEVWGGFRVDGEVRADFLIVTNGGEDSDWFSGSGFSAHRKEQATFLFDGSTGTFNDCFWIDNPGQPLHGGGGTIILDRCLIQRSPTVGQFNGGAVTLTGCHLVEFPEDSTRFTEADADGDYDGIYFTNGTHVLTDTVVGWTKDDGIDAGSGGNGTVTITDCWFESCYHEGLALSGTGRVVEINGTVAINNGQGIECGYSTGSITPSPMVTVRSSLCIGNLVGWRFGDNYDWDYFGDLDVSGSIALHNLRDVWGYEWDSWDYRSADMTIENNKITAANAMHPTNAVWDPATDGSDLDPFMAIPGSVVGLGFGMEQAQLPLSDYGDALPIGLSSFTSQEVSVPYTVSVKLQGAAEAMLETGSVTLPAGSFVGSITPGPLPPVGVVQYIRVSLSSPTNAEITGARDIVYVNPPAPEPAVNLIARGATWSYLDDGDDPGATWKTPTFDDSLWQSGPAELGYGDGGEPTELDDSPANYPTYYFRHEFEVPDPTAYGRLILDILRDDGAVIYLNGGEVWRTNMDPGPVAHGDFAAGTTPNSSEGDYRSYEFDPGDLVAGTNLLAVEVHQANATSSDVSFDFELNGAPRVNPVFELSGSRGGALLLIWEGDGFEPEQSTDLQTWTPMPDASSPMEIGPEPSSTTKFYRLAPGS